MLFSGITPFLSKSIADLKPKESIVVVEELEEYLYLNEVTETEYESRPKGACYIIVDIVGIDFTSFMIDDDVYEVSYGLNIIPINFSNIPFKSYRLQFDPVDLPYFKSIAIEPFFLAEDEVELILGQETSISFQAGGPISILSRINFSYNSFSVELINNIGESTVLKSDYESYGYANIDPLFYSLFFEHGTYIRYDAFLDPGEHTLILGGNGSLEYRLF